MKYIGFRDALWHPKSYGNCSCISDNVLAEMNYKFEWNTLSYGI